MMIFQNFNYYYFFSISEVRDSKCDYPAACNSVETILIHKDHFKSGQLNLICDSLRENGVELFSGPKLFEQLTFGPPKGKYILFCLF